MFLLINIFCIFVLIVGCEESTSPQNNVVVVYTSEDQVFSEPILRDFEKETGIKVKAVFDTEESKSTGVMNRLIAEKNNPQADVFWANEPIRAEGLKQKIRWGVSLWANVNRRGDYNTIHCHPDATWSCVYYVDCGDIDPNNDKSGVITFLTPNAASGVSFFTETVGNKFNVWPESGLMLVFPSYLTHMVHPYTGKRPRVSISLNYQPLRGPRPGAPG